jgi:hypothetical protein
MITFIWDKLVNFIQDENGLIQLEEKPIFSFEYEFIKYNTINIKEYGIDVNQEPLELNEKQIEEIKSFIVDKRKEYGIRKLAVDTNGLFLGYVKVDELDSKFYVPLQPPNPDLWVWNFEDKVWQKGYYYNENFKLSSKETSIGFTTKEPPQQYFEVIWSTEKNNWVIDDKNDNWKTIYKNKIVSDIIIDYIHTHLDLIHTPENNLANEFLMKIKDVIIEESKKVIDDASIDKGTLDKIQVLNDDTKNIFEAIANADDVLPVYGEYYEFKTKIQEDIVYKSKNDFSDEIVGDYLKNNTIT